MKTQYKIVISSEYYTANIAKISKHIPSNIKYADSGYETRMFDLTDEQVVLLRLKYNFPEIENVVFNLPNNASFKFIAWTQGIGLWVAEQREKRLIEIFSYL